MNYGAQPPNTGGLKQRVVGYVSGKEKGFVCDGVADDTAALQALLVELGSTSVTVAIHGPCKIQSNITIPSTLPVRFEGNGSFVGTGVVTYTAWSGASTGPQGEKGDPGDDGAGILASSFGVVADGVLNADGSFSGTNNTSALTDMRTHLRAHDGQTVHMPPGIILYSDNRWLVGVRNVVVVSHGTSFVCTAQVSQNGQGDSDPLSLNFMANPWGYPAHRIATAWQNASTIQTLTAAHAGTYAIGDWIWVYGYQTYVAGWPPAMRHQEVARVTAVNAETGEITLARGLKNTFRQDWRDYAYSAFGVSDSIGAARILKLSPRDPANVIGTLPAIMPESVTFYGGTFLRGPHQPDYYGGPSDLGGLLIGGCWDMLRFDGVKAGYLSTGTCTKIIVRDSQFLTGINLDKNCESFTLDNSEIGYLAGGWQIGSLALTRSVIREGIESHARSAMVEFCDIYNGGQDSRWGLQLQVSHLGVAKANKVYRSVHSNDPAGHNFYGAGVQCGPIAVAANPTSNSFEVARDSYPTLPTVWMWPGLRIFTKPSAGGDINEGVVTDVYDNGTNTVVLVRQFRFAPTVGDQFYVNSTRRFDFQGNMDMYLNPQDGNYLADAPGRNFTDEVVGNNLHELKSISVPFPPNSDAVTIPTPGNALLMMIRFVVLTPDPGSHYPQVYSSGQPDGTAYYAVSVNGGLAGVREIDNFATRGGQTGDSLTVLPHGSGGFFQQNVAAWNLGYAGGTGTRYPRGWVEFVYRIAPGPFGPGAAQ